MTTAKQRITEDDAPVELLVLPVAAGVAPDADQRKFDPSQPRDPNGKWGNGAGDVDLADDDDPDREHEDEPDEYENDRMPAEYTAKYGQVIGSTDFDNTGEWSVAMTDKQHLHVAKGKEDRQVVQPLTPRAARGLSDDVYEVQNGDIEAVINSDTKARIVRSGTDDVSITWANGQRDTFSSDDAFGLQEALSLMADNYQAEFGKRAKPPAEEAS